MSYFDVQWYLRFSLPGTSSWVTLQKKKKKIHRRLRMLYWKSGKISGNYSMTVVSDWKQLMRIWDETYREIKCVPGASWICGSSSGWLWVSGSCHLPAGLGQRLPLRQGRIIFNLLFPGFSFDPPRIDTPKGDTCLCCEQRTGHMSSLQTRLGRVNTSC